MIFGLISMIINIISVFISINVFKRSARYGIMYKKLYENTYKIENEMRNELNNVKLPEDVTIQEVTKAITDHAHMIRVKYMDNMKEYTKYSISTLFLILFNGILLIFNIVQYQLWKYVVIMILKIWIKIIGG